MQAAVALLAFALFLSGAAPSRAFSIEWPLTTLAERLPVLTCDSPDHLVMLVELMKKESIEPARHLYQMLNALPFKLCDLKPPGKVAKFAVIKKFPPVDFYIEKRLYLDYRMETWVVRVEYADGRVSYIAIDRLVYVGRLI